MVGVYEVYLGIGPPKRPAASGISGAILVGLAFWLDRSAKRRRHKDTKATVKETPSLEAGVLVHALDLFAMFRVALPAAHAVAGELDRATARPLQPPADSRRDRDRPRLLPPLSRPADAAVLGANDQRRQPDER
jgi:hypothetical protein